jgi:hypothetical protein
MKKVIMGLALALATINAKSQDSITVSKDDISGDYYAMAPRDLLCVSESRDKGFKVWMSVDYVKNKIKYRGLIFKSFGIGSCFENDNIIIVFEDGTKYTCNSWSNFNCDGDSYFDLYGKDINLLNKKIKAIRLTNGRSSESYTHYITGDDANAFIVNIDAILNNKIKFEKK